MSSLFGILPLLVVSLGVLLLMLAEAFGRAPATAGKTLDTFDAGSGRQSELGVVAAVVLFAGAIAAVAVGLAGPERLGVEGLLPYLVVDRFSIFASFVICLLAGLVCLLASGYLGEHGIDRSEFFPLLGWSTVGALGLVAAGDLLSLFVSLETLSLGVYCLIGLRRTGRALEAALKYFLLGSFASALLLFGSALLYGATGHTDLAGIGTAVGAVAAGAKGSALLVSGMVLVLAGFSFKVAVVPFHGWTPDAYEGAATPATAYMASVVKMAAFAALMRVLFVAFADERLSSWGAGWPPIFALFAVLSMTGANLVAGRQRSVKRMLAYSSIAHAGYAMVGVVSAIRAPDAQSSVMFYLFAYALSTAGAFGALILCGSAGKEATTLEDLAGLGRRHPAVALPFALFLLSLAGIPPTAGFFGKLYIFKTAIEGDLTWLVLLGLVNSVIGAYYYLRVIVAMYMREPEPDAPVAVPMRAPAVGVALAILALGVLWLGLFPGAALSALSQATLGVSAH